MILSHDQQLYIYQSRRSKELCLEMDMLILELAYHTEKLNYQEIERFQNRLDKVKAKLSQLWEVQIDLYFKIKQEQQIKKP